MKNKKISVVIPVYNEEKNIEKLFERLVPVMDNFERDYEIVLADDGSTDTSLEILLKHIDKRIRIIELTKNYGQHAAIFAGFEGCTGDIIITMDAALPSPSKIGCSFAVQVIASSPWMQTSRIRRKRFPGL